MSRWEWELRDLSGVTIGLLQPRRVDVTRVLNGSCAVALDTETAPAFTTAAVLLGWRAPAGGGARVLRATGKVRTAMQLAAARDALDVLNIQGSDAFGVFGERLVAAAVTYTQQAPRAIVEALVAAQEARAPVGLTVTGADPAGPLRDRTYDRGKNAGEAVTQLAEVDDGFYFRVDPVDDPAYSDLVLLYPGPGGTSTASFEFGEGTAANLAGIQVDVRPPVNYVTAFGAGQGEDQLVSVAFDQASIDAYGLVDASRSFSDVVEQATLDQHALDMLRPDERRTFKVEVAAPVGNEELALPSPWDDFDVGDTVQLNLRTSALSYTGRALVKSFTASTDANGVERLSAIDFQED